MCYATIFYHFPLATQAEDDAGTSHEPSADLVDGERASPERAANEERQTPPPPAPSGGDASSVSGNGESPEEPLMCYHLRLLVSKLLGGNVNSMKWNQPHVHR